MPSKTALVDFNKCAVATCNDGVCLAAQACQRRILIQENRFEVPMVNPSVCRACADCVLACPHGAVRISVY